VGLPGNTTAADDHPHRCYHAKDGGRDADAKISYTGTDAARQDGYARASDSAPIDTGAYHARTGHSGARDTRTSDASSDEPHPRYTDSVQAGFCYTNSGYTGASYRPLHCGHPRCWWRE